MTGTPQPAQTSVNMPNPAVREHAAGRASGKAAMVSNLLVVLCGERSTQPVVNTSSLYH